MENDKCHAFINKKIKIYNYDCVNNCSTIACVLDRNEIKDNNVVTMIMIMLESTLLLLCTY